MKTNLLFLTNRLFVKVLFLGMISIVITGLDTATAQVTFKQTLNADFNKGVLNNAVVASDNVYLQPGASDVGTWLTTTVLPQSSFPLNPSGLFEYISFVICFKIFCVFHDSPT